MFDKIQFFEDKYGNKVYNAEMYKHTFNLSWVDRVVKFTGTHPAVMKSKIDSFNYRFEHDKSKAIWKAKDKLIQPIEDFLGIRIGEYKNYILKK